MMPYFGVKPEKLERQEIVYILSLNFLFIKTNNKSK